MKNYALNDIYPPRVYSRKSDEAVTLLELSKSRSGRAWMGGCLGTLSTPP